MGIRPGSQSPGSIVHKQIGSAYDNVKKVADNIEDVVSVSGSIETIDEILNAASGHVLNDIAAIYSIPEQDLYIYPTDGTSQIGKYYLFKRGGIAEVWQALSLVAPADPMNGNFKQLKISADGGGDVEMIYGQVPSNYISGPLHLIIDGVESSETFNYVDSYSPTAGDNVVAMGDVVVGLIASVEPLMENICMFYGYPNAVNSYWDTSASARFYSKFHGVVFGDKMGEPDHVANADTVEIIRLTKILNPTIKIFGYVPIGLDPAWQDSSLPIEEIRTRIDNWKNSGATHIFLDEFGYDYYVDRKRQNDCILHSRSLGMPVVANSWSADYCFSNKNIVLPWINNFEGNPTELPCLLGPDDYVLFENVLYKFHHTPGEGSYADPEQWVNDNQRIIDMYEYTQTPRDEYDGKSYYETYKTKGFALDSIIQPDQKMYSESYLVALAAGMHAHSASVAFWGAANSTYPTYNVPEIKAASRVAVGKPEIEVFGGQYVGRMTTQVGPDEIEVTWVQQESEIKFDEASLANGLEPKKNIRTVVFPAGLQVNGSGYFTMTLGSSSDDARNMSIALTGTETREELIAAVFSYNWSPAFLDLYEVTREGDNIVFTSREPYTEELTEWWVWHTAGAITPEMSEIEETQVGTDGKSLEYREVRINGVAVDYGFGPYWRKPRQVQDGYIYFDTDNNRNITYRNRVWYDMNGNRADEFIDTIGVPVGAIIMIVEGVEIPNGWKLCDGQDGRPLIDTSPNPTIIKIDTKTVEKPKLPLGEATATYSFGVLIIDIGDFRGIDDNIPKRAWNNSQNGNLELFSSMPAYHYVDNGVNRTSVSFDLPSPDYKLPEPFNLSFTMQNGDEVQGTVVSAADPEVSVTNARYYYWINSPDSNMTFSFDLSGAAIDGNIPATVDDGNVNLTAVETSVGLDGKILLKFRLGDSQSLRRLNNPFIVSVTTFDGEVIEINSNSAEEIAQ